MKKVMIAALLCSLFAYPVYADGGVVGIEPTINADGTSVIEDLLGFDYDIRGDEIVINRYRGNAKVLIIYGYYTIDGYTYKTNLEECEMGISNSVKAVVFEEGIETLSHAFFNTCSVQKVYFPLSMTAVEDGTLSYLHPDKNEEYIQIYYEGTQEQWSQIFTKYETMTLEKAEDAGDYGRAAADWLNGLLGAEYDSSKYEYFFEAQPDDLINSIE